MSRSFRTTPGSRRFRLRSSADHALEKKGERRRRQVQLNAETGAARMTDEAREVLADHLEEKGRLDQATRLRRGHDSPL